MVDGPGRIMRIYKRLTYCMSDHSALTWYCGYDGRVSCSYSWGGCIFQLWVDREARSRVRGTAVNSADGWSWYKDGVAEVLVVELAGWKRVCDV